MKDRNKVVKMVIIITITNPRHLHQYIMKIMVTLVILGKDDHILFVKIIDLN